MSMCLMSHDNTRRVYKVSAHIQTHAVKYISEIFLVFAMHHRAAQEGQPVVLEWKNKDNTYK